MNISFVPVMASEDLKQSKNINIAANNVSLDQHYTVTYSKRSVMKSDAKRCLSKQSMTLMG